MSSIQHEYVPVGSLRLSGIAQDLCSREAFVWSQFVPPGADEIGDVDVSMNGDGTSSSMLPEEMQDALLNHHKLRPFRSLFEQRWIALEAGLGSPDAGDGLVRVYMLPDDRCRQAIDRSDVKLRRARNKLFNELDTSAACWSGKLEHHPLDAGGAGPDVNNGSSEEASLLHLFNTIPSPGPSADRVRDVDAQEAIFSLLESRVQGLKTELYPYQRRSAAMMLQRENEPGKVLDPRLSLRKDHDGRPWYHDPVGGTILRDPQHYGGISGGILAEQMGAGKTLICLSVVLASRRLRVSPPEICPVSDPPVRKRMASLMRMAASCATRNGVPWRYYFDAYDGNSSGTDFVKCMNELAKEPGFYLKSSPTEEPRLLTRQTRNHNPIPRDPKSSPRQTQNHNPRPGDPPQQLPTKIYLSTGSLIIVPPNLVQQWQQEIKKHTQGLRVMTVVGHDYIPSARELVDADIVLFSQPRFEKILDDDKGGFPQHIRVIHFKRCIIDEGHRIGNSKMTAKSKLLLTLDELHIGHRWIVTGTPSKGLYGVEGDELSQQTRPLSDAESRKQEQADLNRIGAMAKLYLKARPWANTAAESGDTVADWNTYIALRRHGRQSVIQETLNSLIIRHQLSDIGTMLPKVNEKIVRLDGSYQDRLSLNVFHMMIVFNAAQSQRTDQDYFFHPRQRKFLIELVRNMRQATFFGGLFFPENDIAKSLQMAREFLLTKADGLGVSSEDVTMLKEAIDIGDMAIQNKLRRSGSLFHEIPLMAADLPTDAGSAWSLDGRASSNGLACTSATMLHTLQRSVGEALKSPTAWNTFINGQMAQRGNAERGRILKPTESKTSTQEKGRPGLAGATTAGTSEGPRKVRGWSALKPSEDVVTRDKPDEEAVALPDAFKQARIVATASAKLSYLLDSIDKHQSEEQIIVFYDDENIAWFLASALDVLEVKYLIYAKSLSVERRAQYVDSFIQNSEFRVLLMDIGQAAFGLDIRVASRIYFINPVLNPQVEAQAIGRARRVSQKQGEVTVETLVLRDSIDELIVERRARMSALEHRQCKTVLDDRPIANWIKNVRILAMPGSGPEGSDLEQDAGDEKTTHEPASRFQDEMQLLDEPKTLFRRASGAREEDPDAGLVERYKFVGIEGTPHKSLKRPLNDADRPLGEVEARGGAAGGGKEAAARTSGGRSPLLTGKNDDAADGTTSKHTPSPEPKKRKIMFAT